MHENPTPLRIGAQGQLDGRRWRVAGRVVLGMRADDGETYYWNEFNLVDGFGRSATLVFEEGEQGPEWKLFTYLEVLRAMTAQEAATKRVGDTVALDGNPARITLVDQSRVYHIEGVGPEGVEVGDVANYFNVDTGERMLVASWSGEDIEFYEGKDIPSAHVHEAFKLRSDAPAFARSDVSSAVGMGKGTTLPVKVVLIALLGIIIFAVYACSASRHKRSLAVRPPAAKKAAPTSLLQVGNAGTLAQTKYTIDARATVEIARVGARHDRHEYSLINDANGRSILIQGLNGVGTEWHLFVPITGSALRNVSSPYDAAAKRRGSVVTFDGRAVPITDLFQAKTLSKRGVDGAGVWQPLQYGFVAHEADTWLIARWTETGVQFHRGQSVTDKAVLAAFARTAEKTP